MKRLHSRFVSRLVPYLLRLWPVGILTFLCIAFFWDVFLLPANQVLGGEDLENLFWHWSQFAVSSLRHGQFPLWNPYLFSGIPFSANPQPALFYPPTWLASFVPVNKALGLTVLLHVWIASVGMYAWMRSESASRIGALLAAVTFAFSGYFFARIRGGHVGVLTTGSWLPLLLWAHRSVCARRQWTLAIIGGLPFGLAILAGHTASVMYVALGLMAYGVFQTWKAWQKEQSISEAAFPFVSICLMFFVGMAVAAVQLLPTAEFVIRSTRRAAATYDFAARFSWPPGHLLTLLVPNFFGEPTQTGYWSDGIYDEFVFYVGLLPLLLAFVGLKLRHRLRGFLLLVGLGALLLAFGEYTVLHRLFYRFVPLYRMMRAPARAGYLFTLAAAALSGLTLTALERSGHRRRASFLAPLSWSVALIVAGVVLVLIVAGFVVFAIGREAIPSAGRLWHQANEMTLFLLFFVLSIGLLISWKETSTGQRRSWWLAVALVVLDLWTFGNGILEIRTVPESAYWRIVSQSVSDTPITRVLPWGLNEAEQNGGMAFDLQNVFGYDPLILKRYEDFITSKPDPRARTYDLLNAGYLVTTAPQEFPEEPGEPRLLREESGVYVYERPDSLPRAWIVGRAKVMEDTAILTQIHEPTFDPRTTALVEEPVSCDGTGGSVEITDYPGNHIKAQTEGGGGVLVFSEIYYPGWEATVDGKHTELLRADYVLRALCVPAGRHEVVLRYDPPILKAGLFVTGFALLSVVGAAVWTLKAGLNDATG